MLHISFNILLFSLNIIEIYHVDTCWSNFSFFFNHGRSFYNLKVKKVFWSTKQNLDAIKDW